MEAINVYRRALRDFIARQGGSRATIEKYFAGAKRADSSMAELMAFPETVVASAQVLDPSDSSFGQNKFMWGIDRLGVDAL